jgi:hypothetical protein
MRTCLTAILIGVISFDAIGMQCSRDAVPVAAATKTSAQITASIKTLSNQRLSECSISLATWTRDQTARKLVWDIRDTSLRMRRAITGATMMSPASAQGTIISAGQSILLIGDSLDPKVAHELCASMRARGHQTFVLDGGDRAWRTHGVASSAVSSVREAELTINTASLWLGDAATNWIALDGTNTDAKTYAENNVRTIYFRADSLSSLRLRTSLESSTSLDERSWWVDATQEELERVADQGRRMAASRNASLVKPCGVN